MSETVDNIEILHTAGEGLQHDFRVRIAASDLESRLRHRMAELRPQMKLRGFRPGKVPESHIRRMYGKSLMEEIISQAMQETGSKACNDAGFTPAVDPDVTLISEPEKVLGGQSDLEYEMRIEAIPEFGAMDVAKLTLSRPVIAPDEQALQARLEQLASRNASYHKRDGRAAINGDALLIDFVGRIDGEAFEGGTAEEQQIVLGSGSFIPGFEEGLLGSRAGDARDISVSFPEDYGSEALRGKAAVFSVQVKEVREAEIPAVGDELAKALGLEDIEKLKDILRNQLQMDYQQRTRAVLKWRLFNALEEAHDFALPQGMVEAELNELWQSEQRQQKSSDASVEPEDSEEQWRDKYKKTAQRRVRLGLILAQIGKQAEIEIKPQEMERAIAAEASRHYGREKEATEFIQSNKAALARIRAPLFEEKVVDYIVARAQMSETTVTLDELAGLEAALESEPEAEPV